MDTPLLSIFSLFSLPFPHPIIPHPPLAFIPHGSSNKNQNWMIPKNAISGSKKKNLNCKKISGKDHFGPGIKSALYVRTYIRTYVRTYACTYVRTSLHTHVRTWVSEVCISIRSIQAETNASLQHSERAWLGVFLWQATALQCNALMELLPETRFRP